MGCNLIAQKIDYLNTNKKIKNLVFEKNGNIDPNYSAQLHLSCSSDFCFLHSYYPFYCISPLHLKFYTFLFACISIPVCNCGVSQCHMTTYF